MESIFNQVLLADNLADLFALRVAESPEQVMARFDDEIVTYIEMKSRVDQVRASLQRDGAKKGERVATYLHNSVTHLTILLACACEGIVWCPINVSVARSDLRYALTDLEPAVIFVGRDLAATFEEAEIEGLTPIYVEDETQGLNGIEDWLSLDEPEIAPKILPSDSLAIIYSGGTTGLPKGIIMSHFGAVAHALRFNEMSEFETEEHFFSALQFYHGWMPLMVLPFCIYYGHQFCFWRWWSTSKFRDYVRKYEATIIDPYVGMVGTLMQSPPQPGDRDMTPRLAIGGYGGDDAMSISLRSRFEKQFGIETLQVYGLTEVGGLACVEFSGESHKPGSTGKTRGWYSITVADEDGIEVKPRTIGEILVRPNVPNILAKGYHNRWQETVHSWRDLWVHTGDLAYVDEDGDLFFVGRKGHFVRRRGELVSVFEVELTLLAFPGVREVAVVGVPSEMGEDDIKACVVCRDEKIDPTELLAFCEKEIAYFKVPRFVEFLDELPRSALKHEIERFRLIKSGVEGVWDRTKFESNRGGRRRK
jgi:crotonobetaine/carnitine-CoA ligase